MKLEGIDKIMDRIREKLGARGIRGIISIARAFKVTLFPIIFFSCKIFFFIFLINV